MQMSRCQRIGSEIRSQDVSYVQDIDIIQKRGELLRHQINYNISTYLQGCHKMAGIFETCFSIYGIFTIVKRIVLKFA